MMRAELADGRVLEFPDGTDPAVIQATVKRVLGAQMPTRPERPAAPAGADPFQQQAQEPGFFQTGAISTGRGLAKIGRALGLVDPESETERRAFEALGKERPAVTAIGEAVGESLPFAAIPVGGLAAGAGKTAGKIGLQKLGGFLAGRGGQVASQAALGATEGALIARGEGASGGQQFKSGGVGGAAAGTVEAFLPVIGRLGGRVFRKITGRAPKGALIDAAGQPTAELTGALDSAGLSFDDLAEGTRDIISGAPAGTDPEQAVRKAFLEQAGLTGEAAPTTAQITRDATDFQAQQEAAKVSGKVRGRLENQDAVLSNKFGDLVRGTGGEPIVSDSPVFTQVLNKSTELDNEISGLYQVARERAAGGGVVDLSGTFKALEDMRPSDSVMGGPISSIEGEARRLGILDPDTGVSRAATVEEAELLRKFSNQLYDSVTKFGRQGLKNFRDSVDDEVTKSAGEDIFSAGRKAKSDFEKGLGTAKSSKFSKRKVNVVRDILEDKIGPDELFDKVILGKKYRKEDVETLKRYMDSGTPEQKEAGKKAFDDLRAETVEWIKNTALQGPEDARGFKAMSRASLERALKRVGTPKLEAILNPDEMRVLDELLKVSRLREPARGTAIGEGPSAQAINSLKRRIDKIPVLGVLVDLEWDRGAGVLKAKPAIKPPEPGALTQIAAPLGAAAGVGLTAPDERRQ